MSSTSQIRKTDSPILNRQWTLFYTIALTQLLDSKPVGTTRRMMFTLISSSAPEAPVFACVMYRVRVCFFFRGPMIYDTPLTSDYKNENDDDNNN